MPRQARVVIPGAPHHVTQRGNRRQRTFFDDADYQAWLDLAAEAFRAAEVEVWAYCLMPNHIHLIAAPSRPEALAQAVGATNLRYTRRVNRRERWTGFLWQGRFASFPMDENHLRTCARYIGLNPVRAGLSARATTTSPQLLSIAHDHKLIRKQCNLGHCFSVLVCELDFVGFSRTGEDLNNCAYRSLWKLIVRQRMNQ